MSDTITELLPHVKQNEPASDGALIELLGQVDLPTAYVDILRSSDGLEGDVNKNAYIKLWKAEDLVRRNQACGSEEFTPGLFLIGSDGGDTAYGLDIRPSSATYGYYVTLPFITVGWSDVQVLGATFADFISKLKEGLD